MGLIVLPDILLGAQIFSDNEGMTINGSTYLAYHYPSYALLGNQKRHNVALSFGRKTQ
jgi:hypothetical protein